MKYLKTLDPGGSSVEDTAWKHALPKSERKLRGASEKRRQLASGLEQRNWFKFLECRCKGIRERPHRARLKILLRRIEIQPVNHTIEMAWHFERGFDEGSIDEESGVDIGQLRLTPSFNGLHHRLEVSLHLINADR